MKNLILIAALALMAGSCTDNDKNGYTVEGKIAGLTGQVYLLNQQGEPLDSTKVEQDGAFRMRGMIEEPVIAYLRGEGRPFAMFFLEQGKISVDGDLKDPSAIQIDGTGANIANRSFSEKARSLMESYRQPGLTDEQRDNIEQQYNDLLKQTIDANRNNVFGAYLLSDATYDMTAQEILDEVGKFTPEMQQTKLLKEVKSLAERKMKVEVGQPYTAIEQPDAEGKNIALSTLVGPGRYVLLDFWASWCGPCMHEVPYLVKTYKAFHKRGFEIYGVSLDNDKERWQNAIRENGMDWTQVSELKGFDTQAVKDYAVEGIPANFLIGPDGKIVARGLRGDDLYQKVEELLGK